MTPSTICAFSNGTATNAWPQMAQNGPGWPQTSELDHNCILRFWGYFREMFVGHSWHHHKMPFWVMLRGFWAHGRPILTKPAQIPCNMTNAYILRGRLGHFGPIWANIVPNSGQTGPKMAASSSGDSGERPTPRAYGRREARAPCVGGARATYALSQNWLRLGGRL